MILPEESRREESRSEGAGCILADGRQQPEGVSDRGGHVIKLPADLLTHSICPVRRGETSSLRGICRGTEGMRAHMRDACGLPSRPSGRGRCRRPHFALRDATNEAATNSLCDAELATREIPRPGNQFTRAAIPWGHRLEDRQHVLCAICRPRRDGPPVGFAECLRRAHT